jgi:hypothetical protein
VAGIGIWRAAPGTGGASRGCPPYWRLGRAELPSGRAAGGRTGPETHGLADRAVGPRTDVTRLPAVEGTCYVSTLTSRRSVISWAFVAITGYVWVRSNWYVWVRPARSAAAAWPRGTNCGPAVEQSPALLLVAAPPPPGRRPQGALDAAFRRLLSAGPTYPPVAIRRRPLSAGAPAAAAVQRARPPCRQVLARASLPGCQTCVRQWYPGGCV